MTESMLQASRRELRLCSTFKLYPFQEETVGQCRNAHGDFKSGIVCIPCGGGKTVVAIACLTTMDHHSRQDPLEFEHPRSTTPTTPMLEPVTPKVAPVAPSSGRCLSWSHLMPRAANEEDEKEEEEEEEEIAAVVDEDEHKDADTLALTTTVRHRVTTRPVVSTAPSFLVVTNSRDSADQWRRELLQRCTIQPHEIFRCNIDQDLGLAQRARVVIGTYTFLTNGKPSLTNKYILRILRNRVYMAQILDEAHLSAAEQFGKVIGKIPMDDDDDGRYFLHVKVRIGFTATPYNQSLLERYIGPMLYRIDVPSLRRLGHLSQVYICQLRCVMSYPAHWLLQEDRDKAIPRQVREMNPDNLQMVLELYRHTVREYQAKPHHSRQQIKAIIQGQYKRPLKLLYRIFQDALGAKYNMVYIDGDNTKEDRASRIAAFSDNPNVHILFVSSIGDTAMNMPAANLAIKMSFHRGSEYRDNQAVGRIQRYRPGVNEAQQHFVWSKYHKEDEFVAIQKKALERDGYVVDDKTFEDLKPRRKMCDKYLAWIHEAIQDFFRERRERWAEKKKKKKQKKSKDDEDDEEKTLTTVASSRRKRKLVIRSSRTTTTTTTTSPSAAPHTVMDVLRLHLPQHH